MTWLASRPEGWSNRSNGPPLPANFLRTSLGVNNVAHFFPPTFSLEKVLIGWTGWTTPAFLRPSGGPTPGPTPGPTLVQLGNNTKLPFRWGMVDPNSTARSRSSCGPTRGTQGVSNPRLVQPGPFGRI